jgi:hypothetical protein
MSPDPFLDLLEAVCTPLEMAGVKYAITGSIASSIHGEPFDSQDVDICLYMSELQARRLATLLPQRFYRDLDAMVEAARRGGLANLLDAATGWKVDLCVLPDTEYFHSVLDRRVQASFGNGGPHFWTVSPEDIILMKLDWRKDSRSEKQWNNALSVMRSQFSRLDWKYLHHWAGRLGIMVDFEELRRAAEA